MMPQSACQHWQPDRQLIPAQSSRSYTTLWDTISDAEAWPAVEKIAAEAWVSVRTAHSSLEKLQEAGLIEKVSKGGGARRTSHYVLLGMKDAAANSAPRAELRHPETVQSETRSAQITMQIASGNYAPVAEEPSTEPVKEPINEPGAQNISETLFEEFWQLYPRKTAKPRAEAQYLALLNAVPKQGRYDLECQIIRGLRTFEFSDEEKYQPYPATWLHQRRWEDAKPERPQPYGSGLNSPL